MNTTSVRTRIVKAISIIAAAFVLMISNPLTSNANGINNDKKPASLKDEQVSVQYIGTNDNHVIFKVEFENPTAQKFWMIVKNDAGEVIYHKQFSDVHFSKSVYIQKDEADMIHPTFVIRNGNNEVVRQFEINRTVVENTVVTKL